MNHFDSSLSELTLLINSPKELIQNLIHDDNEISKFEIINDTYLDDKNTNKTKITIKDHHKSTCGWTKNTIEDLGRHLPSTME